MTERSRGRGFMVYDKKDDEEIGPLVRAVQRHFESDLGLRLSNSEVFRAALRHWAGHLGVIPKEGAE